ncbi:MAG: lipase family protein [Nibricoccus sp.]
MSHLSAEDAALIAQRVYLLKDATAADLKAQNRSLGCEGLFKVDAASRFSGKSGGNVLRQLSGFGYITEGDGVREGEILVVTRGTKTFCDVLSDAHCGLRTGPGGLPVHLGFQRIWDSFASELRSFLQGRNPTHVHCVGHSLGGALATLSADYFASLKLPVSLYTFGSPRVGPAAFSDNLTGHVGAENIFRVAHTTDPVTMVPTFPFLHVPTEGKSYTISKGGLIWIGAHYMAQYGDSVTGKSWGSLVNTPVPMDWSDVVARAWLDAVKEGKSGIAMYSVASLNVIAQALRWLIRKALSFGIDFMCLEMTESFTAADMMAKLVSQAPALSKELADDTRTIMSAVLQFLGRPATTPREITFEFADWVFTLLRTTLHIMAGRALMSNALER